MTAPTPEQVLDAPLDPGDAATEGETVRGYLKRVGRLSGGDNTWKWPLYVALAEAGLLPGVAVDPADADGDVLGNFPVAAQAQADGLIAAAAKALEASPVTGDTSPDLAPLPSAAAVVRYMRASGWTHGRQGSYGAMWTRGDVSFAVPHEDDRPSWLREVVGRLASAEGRTPEVTGAAIAAFASSARPVKDCGCGPLEPCGPHLARGAEVDAAGSVPDDSGQAPPARHGQAQERTRPSSPEREAWDRLAGVAPLIRADERERAERAEAQLGVALDALRGLALNEPEMQARYRRASRALEQIAALEVTP